MKLYSADLSPFACRVRLAIYAKGLDIAIVDPPEGGLKGEAYLAINPIGKIPALVLDDGTVIPESDTIVEYLEDAFPDRPLRPATPEGKAKARLVARVMEIYVGGPMGALFGQMNPKTRDAALVEAKLAELEKGMEWLNLFLEPNGANAVGDSFSTADCELIPMLTFVGLMARTFGRPDLISRHDKIAAYHAAISATELGQKGQAEIMRGLAALRGG